MNFSKKTPGITVFLQQFSSLIIILMLFQEIIKFFIYVNPIKFTEILPTEALNSTITGTMYLD